MLFPYGIIHTLVQLLGKRPQLRLGVRGIQVKSNLLDGWRSIQGEQVVDDVLELPLAHRQATLNDLSTDAATVGELLRYYRQHADYSSRVGPRRHRVKQ